MDKLRTDDIFPEVREINLAELTGYPTARGKTTAIISAGKIVNVVSSRYTLLTNDRFFGDVDNAIQETGMDFRKRSENRENSAFAVDYILNDERYTVSIHNGQDKIMPMLRFTNSYDGSIKTSGRFGFFRQVCSNGLHVAKSQIGFSIRHVGEMERLTIPNVRKLVETFHENEFYTITRKFEELSRRPIEDVRHFVKLHADKAKLFKFEKSDKNPEPSAHAQWIIDTINREAKNFNERTNAWHGYNAFNEILHGKMKKGFEQQHAIDSRLFNQIFEEEFA
jgi:hypothetical protein